MAPRGGASTKLSYIVDSASEDEFQQENNANLILTPESAAEIHAYFEKNRAFYENFPAAKKTIREQLVAVKRNAVANAFFEKLPSEFKVAYSGER